MLCPDLPRAAMALSAAVVLSFAHGAWLQAAVLTVSGAAGYFFCKDVQLGESHASERINMRAAWLTIAAALALLIALRVLALEMPHSLFALADIFYRSGALVFGGGHVVLPLLHDALVPAGWISDDAFLNGYGAAQLLPGPLFSVAAYLGAESAPRGAAILGAGIAVLCIFLPGMLLAVGGRAAWNHAARISARARCARRRECRRGGNSRRRALQPRVDGRAGHAAMIKASYLRLVPGDVNGFLGLVVDNLSVLALLAAVLIGGYGIPASIVFGRMFPGTALGVLVGDLIYTWLALRLARRTGRSDVTAMPFGLDTPSSIGMALLVLGPAFAKFRAAGLAPEAAGLETWYLGMAATATMGVVKFVWRLAEGRCGA